MTIERDRAYLPVERIKRGSHDLGHHASPRDDVCLTFRRRALFEINDRLQEAV